MKKCSGEEDEDKSVSESAKQHLSPYARKRSGGFTFSRYGMCLTVLLTWRVSPTSQDVGPKRI
jgi:hypothetical protein